MVKASKFGQMERSTKVTLEMTRLMERGGLFMRAGTTMRVIGLTISFPVMESIQVLLGQFIQVTGLTTNKMGLE